MIQDHFDNLKNEIDSTDSSDLDTWLLDIVILCVIYKMYCMCNQSDHVQLESWLEEVFLWILDDGAEWLVQPVSGVLPI